MHFAGTIIRRPKNGHYSFGEIIVAPLPPRLVDKGIPNPSLVSQTLIG